MTEMNLQLHHVVADMTGGTGLRIILAILAGERDPEALACLRHYNCHSSAETIAKALTGSYRAEHLFALEQALALYDAYHEKASACDAWIEAVLKELSIHRGHGHGPAPPVSRRRNRTDQANALASGVRETLFALLGKDITTIDGLGSYLSLMFGSSGWTRMQSQDGPAKIQLYRNTCWATATSVRKRPKVTRRCMTSSSTNRPALHFRAHTGRRLDPCRQPAHCGRKKERMWFGGAR
ncbi:hypothetical protein [Bradyrhizobium sp. 142]|uniref:hypothetical protein n=1 Tax=Bradyrhizobium sp. 142 TaxID=2782618 RepID=UPI001FF98A8D|nr:hypothetical protein [Bradyrhizobium sp. 142]MCK1732361.1 hypothetical protein [Bradyrhizobium sp. 142]